MATFSAIVSTEYAVGAPITSSWGSKVSNNVLAIIQGDATASSNRIQEAALSAAVIAQLVTNGDSHNHSGGDGAAIPNASVTGLGSFALLSATPSNSIGISELTSGTSQFNIVSSTTSTATAFGTVIYYHDIYIPSDATTLNYTALYAVNIVATNCYLRLKTSTKTGTTLGAGTNVGSTTNYINFVTNPTGTLDVSDVQGTWVRVNVEGYTDTAGTVYFRGVVGYFT